MDNEKSVHMTPSAFSFLSAFSSQNTPSTDPPISSSASQKVLNYQCNPVHDTAFENNKAPYLVPCRDSNSTRIETQRKLKTRKALFSTAVRETSPDGREITVPIYGFDESELGSRNLENEHLEAFKPQKPTTILGSDVNEIQLECGENKSPATDMNRTARIPQNMVKISSVCATMRQTNIPNLTSTEDTPPPPPPPPPPFSVIDQRTNKTIVKPLLATSPIASSLPNALRILKSLCSGLSDANTSIEVLLKSSNAESISFNVTSELESLSNDLQELQKIQDVYISEENFIEADKIDQDIQRQKEKICELEKMTCTSPFISYLSLQNEMLHFTHYLYDNISTAVDALQDIREAVVVDVNGRMERETSSLCSDLQNVHVECERVHRETQQIEKESKILADEQLEIERKVQDDTKEYHVILQDAHDKEEQLNHEIEDLEQKLKVKLLARDAVKATITECQENINKNRKRFKQQLTRLDIAQRILTEARRELLADQSRMELMCLDLTKKKAEMTEDLHYVARNIALFTLIYDFLVVLLLLPMHHVRHLRRSLITKVTDLMTLASKGPCLAQVQQHLSDSRLEIGSLNRNVSQLKKQRLILQERLDDLAIQKQVAVEFHHFREAASLTKEQRTATQSLTKIDEDIRNLNNQIQVAMKQLQELEDSESVICNEVNSYSRSRITTLVQFINRHCGGLSHMLHTAFTSVANRDFLSPEKDSGVCPDLYKKPSTSSFSVLLELVNIIHRDIVKQKNISNTATTQSYRQLFDELRTNLEESGIFFDEINCSLDIFSKSLEIQQQECSLSLKACNEWMSSLDTDSLQVSQDDMDGGSTMVSYPENLHAFDTTNIAQLLYPTTASLVQMERIIPFTENQNGQEERKTDDATMQPNSGCIENTTKEEADRDVCHADISSSPDRISSCSASSNSTMHHNPPYISDTSGEQMSDDGVDRLTSVSASNPVNPSLPTVLKSHSMFLWLPPPTTAQDIPSEPPVI